MSKYLVTVTVADTSWEIQVYEEAYSTEDARAQVEDKFHELSHIGIESGVFEIDDVEEMGS